LPLKILTRSYLRNGNEEKAIVVFDKWNNEQWERIRALVPDQVEKVERFFA